MGLNSALVYRLYQKTARLGKTRDFISKETPEDDRTRFMIIQFKRYCKFKLPKIVTNWNVEILNKKYEESIEKFLPAIFCKKKMLGRVFCM